MELHELHVLQGQAPSQHHRASVAGAGVGRSAGEVSAAVSAGREHRHVGAEAVQGAVFQAPREHSAAGSVVVEEQVDGEVLQEKLGVVLQALLVERVQDGVAGPVGSGTGALGNAFAEAGGHAAERALVNPAVLGTGEGNSVVFEFHYRGNRLTAHVLDGVLVAQPVGALDGVVHVPRPVVLPHVSQRRAHPSLGGHGVAPGGKELGDARGAQSLRRDAESRPQSGAPGPYHHCIVVVLDDIVGRHQRPTAMRNSEKTAAAASRMERSLSSTRLETLSHGVWT